MAENKQRWELAGISQKDYEKWCKDNNLPAYKDSTKSKFFSLILANKLVYDKASHTFIRKRPRKKK